MDAFQFNAPLGILAKMYGIGINTVKARLIRGLTLEEALTKCVR
jgi:hypothetical protein